MSAEQKAPEDVMDKQQADFFVAVRARGVLNAMLNGPSEQFEANNPGLRCRWEYSPPSGDQTMVVARESMGFRLVDASELGVQAASEQKSGPVRRGDLVLMCADEQLVNLLEVEDARAAYEDFKLPETTYREYLRNIQVQTKTGEMISPKAVGSGIRQTIETVQAKVPDQPV